MLASTCRAGSRSSRLGALRRLSSDAVPNKMSRRITQPKSQGASQAMLYATGMTEADMSKAQVGIASVWCAARARIARVLRCLHGTLTAVLAQSKSF